MADLQINACDALTDWTNDANCTDAVDGGDFQEGTGCIALTATAGPAWCSDTYNPAGTWDWTGSTYLKLWVKRVAGNLVRLRITDSAAGTEYWNSTPALGNWVEQTLTFGTGLGGGFNKTIVTSIQIYLSSANIGDVLKWDDIRVGPISGLSVPVAMHHYGHIISKVIRG